MNIAPEHVYNQIEDSRNDITDDDSIGEMMSKLYNQKHLDLLFRNTQAVIAIVNLKNYSRLYISEKVKDILGYTPDSDFLQYAHLFAFEQNFFPLKAIGWYFKCLKEIPFESKINQKIDFVGPKIKTNEGRPIKTLIKSSHLDEDQHRNPINVISSLENISHLMKEDVWWLRFSSGSDNQTIVKYYLSSADKTFEGDILSIREKDILRLVQQGFDSQEIANKLFLSLATVHTHRRNMLARTGMKDITALLQIAVSLGMI